MSDIEAGSDDETRSVISNNSDFVDRKMKEYNVKNKNKGVPGLDEDMSDEEDVSEDSDKESLDDELDDSDDDSMSSVLEMENAEEDQPATQKQKKQATKNKPKTKAQVEKEYESDDVMSYGDEYDDMDDEDENEDPTGAEYMRKFDSNMTKNIIEEYHQELKQQNYEEIEALTRTVKNDHGVIIDPLHRTLPFLTKYERARILGERAKQINAGGKPLIQVSDDVIDGYLIALKELEQKRIPFIVKRPLTNGGCEYWKLEDLELL